MKKMLLFAALSLVMVGCCKQSPAGIWALDVEGEGPKPLLVLNEDGTAQSMGMPVMYENWKQEGDNLILTGKIGPRHGCHGKKHGCKPACKEGDKPCCKDSAMLDVEGKPMCCKEGRPEGDKPCCKEGRPEGDKPCCKEGRPEGDKPCCKEGRPEPKEVSDTVAVKSIKKDAMTLLFVCPKSGEQKEVNFKKLDQLPPMPPCHDVRPCCKDKGPKCNGEAPEAAEAVAEPVEEAAEPAA